MFHVPEKNRVTKNHPLASDSSYGNEGAFVITHPKINNYSFFAIASDGEGWEHVSVSLSSTERKVERCPTWEEMCFIKDIFWDKGDCVIQYHPPEKDYVSMHHYCLHLWKSTTFEQPVPDSMLVGINMK